MVYYDLFDWMMEDFNGKKPNFPPNTAERGYFLKDLIVPFDTLHASMEGSFNSRYFGSKSLLLENGQGFRTKGNYSASQLHQVQVMFDIVKFKSEHILNSYSIENIVTNS